MSQAKTKVHVLEDMLRRFLEVHSRNGAPPTISERVLDNQPEGDWRWFSADSLADARGAANIFLRYIERHLGMTFVPRHEIEGWMDQLATALSTGLRDVPDLVELGVQRVLLRVDEEAAHIQVGYTSLLSAV